MTMTKRPHPKTKEEVAEKCLSAVLSFISYGPRAQHEIKNKIERFLQKFFDEEIILEIDKEEIAKSVFDRIFDLGVAGNDSAYARQYVSEKLESANPYSRLEIRNFLYKKGIPQKHIDQALTAYDEDKEREIISVIVGKKLKGKVELQKIQYLTRRGFSSYLVREVLAEN